MKMKLNRSFVLLFAGMSAVLLSRHDESEKPHSQAVECWDSQKKKKKALSNVHLEIC